MPDLHTLTPAAAPLPDPSPRHAVRFYEDDEYLFGAVAEFLADGLACGRPGLVIATPAHRKGILAALATHGTDVLRTRVGGGLTVLDARATLARFMVDGVPHAARFHAAVGEALTAAAMGSHGARVNAFGEMVDLLWQDGNAEGAIRLEALWNEIAETHEFSLLCAYAIGNFDHADDADAFLRVCGHHDHVLPTERYLGLSDAERMRQMSTLEQRARALETEVEYRRRLERRLRAVAAEAEAANRAKSEFLAVMSHELRTPLNAIGGYAELLEMEIRGPISQTQREDLRRIQHSQRHLLGLVNEVLNYTKLETGTVLYELEDVPVREALHAAEALVAPQARARGLRFTVRAADPGLHVRADAEKLRQILVNLLSNAVKFTADGGRVTLRCEARDGEALFHVADSGIGIPAEKLESIFEPFVQVRSDLARPHEGTGLGLAISRSIARAMDGSLAVRSTLGKGSTFTLRLPLGRRLR